MGQRPSSPDYDLRVHLYRPKPALPEPKRKIGYDAGMGAELLTERYMNGIKIGSREFSPATTGLSSRRPYRGGAVWRQLLFPVGDNYFDRSATITSFKNSAIPFTLGLTGV